MNKIIAGCIVTLFFTACADREPDHDSSLTDSTSVKSPIATGSESQKLNTIDTTNNLLAPGAVSVNPMPQQAVDQATATTAPGLNPAHGQPGHRCDIAVGAPLNSPAAKPAAQTVSPTTVTQTATPTPAKTAPGMNPPHGQPGHRCDIAVGAPLNSPATKPATQTVNPASPVIQPVSVPVIEQAKKDSGR